MCVFVYENSNAYGIGIKSTNTTKLEKYSDVVSNFNSPTYAMV